jgi:hypothetical protein
MDKEEICGNVHCQSAVYLHLDDAKVALPVGACALTYQCSFNNATFSPQTISVKSL